LFLDKIESMPQSEKEVLQSKRINKLVERAYKKTPFYEERMQLLELTPEDITSIHDIDKLPLMNREDLLANHPYGLLTIPVSGIARFQILPGSNISVGLTQQDLQYQTEIVTRGLFSCRINSASILLITGIQDEDISGMLALQQAAEDLGATVISGLWNNPEKIIKTIREFGVTTIFSNTRMLFEMNDFMKSAGLLPEKLPLFNILSFHFPDEQRFELEKIFQVPVYNFYGHPDILNIGIAADCHGQNGMHVQDDHIFPEIIDPHSGDVLDRNQPGELVLTTLSREAMPLIRYRTGKIACLESKRCCCGRTTPRLKLINTATE